MYGVAMASHFEPLSWTIHLECNSADLAGDPVAQATFVHEYLHYVQTLTGTVGRMLLVELVRLTVRAGLEKIHGRPLPQGFAQIDLAAALRDSTRADFAGTEVATQYRDFFHDMEFALGDRVVSVAAPADPTRPEERFLRLGYTNGGRSLPEFPHARFHHNGEWLAVPLTDRAFFENMARQVQRNYLYFNANDTSAVDDLRAVRGEATYLVVRRLFEDFLPPGENHAKWTIAASQFALLCRHPGTAFERFLLCAASMQQPDLAEVHRRLSRDPWFLGEFNEPPLQENLNELIQKWGTAMRPTENYQLHELTKFIATAYNSLSGALEFFANPLFKWTDVGGWVRSFGCPRITCSDGEVATLHGVKTTVPWGAYLLGARDLLL
jgi:hypothetical protein